MRSNVKVGGGCRPIGINKPVHEPLKLTGESVRAGIAEREAANKRKQAEQDAEKKKFEDWQAKVDAMRNTVEPGTIVSPRRYNVILEPHKRNPGDFVAFVLLRVGQNYPDEPYYFFGDTGWFGLKVFLSDATKKWLEIHYPDEVDRLRKDRTYAQIAMNRPVKITEHKKTIALGELVLE